jgi:hypothetical protein
MPNNRNLTCNMRAIVASKLDSHAAEAGREVAAAVIAVVEHMTTMPTTIMILISRTRRRRERARTIGPTQQPRADRCSTRDAARYSAVAAVVVAAAANAAAEPAASGCFQWPLVWRSLRTERPASRGSLSRRIDGRVMVAAGGQARSSPAHRTRVGYGTAPIGN